MPKETDKNKKEEEIEEEETEEEIEEEEIEEKEDNSDDLLEAAQKEFRERLEGMGGKFDNAGNFIGFEETNYVPKNDPPVTKLNDPPSFNADEFKKDLLKEFQPSMVSTLINDVIESKPSFKRYKTLVETALAKGSFSNLNKDVVESLFYWARGQGADVEIAEATKTLRSKEKLDAGGEILSESGSKGVKPTALKIDEKVKEYADEWGIDPKVFAAKLKAAKEKKNA